MNSYEVESKLRDKADNWKVFNLENEINNLKRENHFLADKLNDCNNKIYQLETFLRNLVIYLRELNPEKEEILLNF